MIKTIFRNVTFRIRITGAMVALVTMAITLMGFTKGWRVRSTGS